MLHLDPCSHATSRLRTATVTFLILLAAPLVGSAQVQIEEVVAVGTRALPRSVEDSSVPVDIISNEDFEDQAGFDMSNLIRSTVPSFHVSDNPSRDLAALLRPVNLRGLAPDHTLVLMNNKRRHRGSVIQWISNGASNGAQGPDISAIPAIALQRMEVLRDGAAAQYGSDAIAGVLNFVLKDAAEGLALQARYGAYTERSGENMSTIAANFGLPLTDDGFANFSFEYGQSAPTDRSVQHRDATALIGLGIPNVADPAKPWGSPTVDDSIKAVANIGVDLGDSNELYAFGNYASREVSTAFFFRSPMNRNGVYKTSANKFLVAGEGCAARYGDIDSTAANLLSFREMVVADNGCFSFVEMLAEGFTPQFGATISDFSGVVGVRGELANGLMWDVSASIGENSLAAFNHNTLNASLGPDSPRDFDIGDYTQRDTNFNIDMVYPVDLGGSDLNVAAGFEARTEEFQITAGEQAAWENRVVQQVRFRLRLQRLRRLQPGRVRHLGSRQRRRLPGPGSQPHRSLAHRRRGALRGLRRLRRHHQLQARHAPAPVGQLRAARVGRHGLSGADPRPVQCPQSVHGGQRRHQRVRGAGHHRLHPPGGDGARRPRT